MGARGEGVIRFGDEELPLLFTNRALGNVEVATGKTVLQIVSDAREMRLGMTDTAHLLQAALEQGRRDARAGGKPYTVKDAWAVMDEVGWVPALETLMGPLAAVLQFKVEEDGEDPPA